MRALLALLPVALIAACAAAPEPGPESQGDVAESSRSGCNMSRQDILASAGSSARRAAIQRGFAWLDANVPYSQTKFHEGWRTDCSGFVSMCWDLSQSFTTDDFKKGAAENIVLGSYDDLQPGDGLAYHAGKDKGHAMLFLGWNDEAHSAACVLEEADTKDDMQFGPRSMAQVEAQGYVAIRAKSLPAAAPKTSTPTSHPATAPAAATATDPAVTAPPTDGTPCDSDDICNPNLSGTGLICAKKEGKCVPGCKIDLGCPGKLLCVNGHCQ